MNTCDTCKHWNETDYNNGLGECGKITDGGSSGITCNQTTLTTGPKFGCLHHEHNPAIIHWGGIIVCGSEQKFFQVDGETFTSDGHQHRRGAVFYPAMDDEGTAGHGTLAEGHAARDKYLGRTDYTPHEK